MLATLNNKLGEKEREEIDQLKKDLEKQNSERINQMQKDQEEFEKGLQK